MANFLGSEQSLVNDGQKLQKRADVKRCVDEMSENRFPDFYSNRLSSLSKHDPGFLSFFRGAGNVSEY